MEELLAAGVALLATHGYIIVFAWMFADQAGLPLPSIPLLVACGALAAVGDMDLVPLIVSAAAGTLLADVLWYFLGRYQGERAVSFVCRLALEPASCVASTRSAFGRYGPLTLVIAKFLPGVQTLAPASAGLVGAPLVGFVLLDLVGALVFLLPFVLGGYFFQAELMLLLAWLGQVAGGVGALLAAVLSVYAVVKGMQWHAFLEEHRLRRITPADLAARMQSDAPVTVIDLRQRFDFEIDPRVIPGALRIPINEVRIRRDEIPTRYDVVLVCT